MKPTNSHDFVCIKTLLYTYLSDSPRSYHIVIKNNIIKMICEHISSEQITKKILKAAFQYLYIDARRHEANSILFICRRLQYYYLRRAVVGTEWTSRPRIEITCLAFGNTTLLGILFSGILKYWVLMKTYEE